MDTGTPGGQAHKADSERGRQAWRREEAQVSAVLARAVALMESTAQTERGLARTLQDLAAHSGGEAAARRLRLASAANAGAELAVERGEHLVRIAKRRAEHTEVVTLHHLLIHAGVILADLARTEQQIANTLTVLASQDGSELATERQQAADQAAGYARRACDQARALRQLAGAPAAEMSPE